MPRKSGIPRGRALWCALVVAAVAALVSLPALGNGLFWDDAIVLGRQVPAMGDARGAFFPPQGLPQFIPSYYRPVVFLTLLLDRALWGANVFGFHLDVWLLQAVTAGLFYLLMRHLITGRGEGGVGDGWGALAAGLVFAVHPVHAEAVGWIMGRADVLAALFAVVGLLAVVRLAAERGDGRGDGSAQDRRGASVLTRLSLGVFIGLASALALLSKESAIVMPALAGIVLAAASLGGRDGHDRSMFGALSRPGGRIAVGASSCGIVLALALRFAAGTGAAGTTAKSAAASMMEPLARLPGAFAFALQRLVWPWPAPVFHAQVPIIGYAGAFGTILFAALAAASWVSSRSGRAAAVFTGVALVPALAPALTGVSLSPVADRYLYIPSLGVCWMTGVVLARGLEGRVARGPASDRAGLVSRDDPRSAAPGSTVRRAALPAAVLLVPASLGLALAAGTTYRAVASYRDDATYWSAALARAPSDPFLVMKHGQFLADAGRFAEAEAELRRALTLGGKSLGRSTRTVVLDNLGDMALRRGRLDEARGWLDQALAVGPGYAPAHLHLARWHRARYLAAAGDPAGAAGALAAEESRLAVASVDKAISLEPTSAEALLLRADLALDRGDEPAAIGAIKEALRYMSAGADRARIERALRSLEGRL